MAAGDLIIWVSVLVALAIMLPSVVGMQHQAFTDQVAKVEAGQLAKITDAALQYEYGYMATLSAPSSTHTVSIQTLIQQGYLPAGTSAVDAMGDPISVEYQADSSGNVTGYVVAQGNYRYPDPDAGEILLDLGDRGGYVPEVTLPGQVAGTIYGTGDTWQSPAPAGIGAGSIDVKVESNAAQQADDSRFLWRVPAPTAAGNTMSTPLILGAVETPGASCANTGAIAQDGTGALVSCQGGTWQSVGGGHWRAPVSTYAALPASGNQDGDVRLTLDTDRAFAWNGGSWVALAVNQNGNLHVPNNVYADGGKVSTSTSCSGQGTLTAGDITMTTDNGCGVSGSAIQMGSPVTGQAYAIVDAGDGSLDFWNSSAGHSAMQIQPNGEWDLNPYDNGNPDYLVPGEGNDSVEGNSWWGIQPRWSNGWSMVTSEHGYLNANPRAANGSVDVNDIDVRSGGAYPWYSQLSSQTYANMQAISNLQSTVAQQGNQINSNTSSIGAINNRLNQDVATNCSASGYAAITDLCTELANSGIQGMGTPEACPGGGVGTCGPVGPSTYSYWGWCGSRYYRYRCIQYGTNPPAVSLPTENYPQLVVAAATAGIGQGGCGSGASNTGILTLSATSGGAPLAQSAQYAKGGSNYNPTDMYFPFSITFVLPAGQSGQIQLSGGRNGLGCGEFAYQLYRL